MFVSDFFCGQTSECLLNSKRYIFTLKSHTGTSPEALRLRTLRPDSLLPKQRRVTTISRYLIAKIQIKLEITKNFARKIVLQQKKSQNIWNFQEYIVSLQRERNLFRMRAPVGSASTH